MWQQLEFWIRVLAGLVFFGWGAAKLLHYPLTQNRVTLVLAAGPFAVSLFLMLSGFKSDFTYLQPVFFTLALLIAMIILGASHGYAEYRRFRDKLPVQTVLTALGKPHDPLGLLSDDLSDRVRSGSPGGPDDLDRENLSRVIDTYAQKRLPAAESVSNEWKWQSDRTGVSDASRTAGGGQSEAESTDH